MVLQKTKKKGKPNSRTEGLDSLINRRVCATLDLLLALFPPHYVYGADSTFTDPSRSPSFQGGVYSRLGSHF